MKVFTNPFFQMAFQMVASGYWREIGAIPVRKKN
jgi:hypothetical protein